MAAAVTADTEVLDLLVEALPYLRGGLNRHSAEQTAQLLYARLHVAAAAVVSGETLLAFVGLGSDHHLVERPIQTTLVQAALQSGSTIRSRERSEIGCPQADCPLSALLIVPLAVRDDVVGALKLYYAAGAEPHERDEWLASAIARLFGVYLELSELDSRAALVTHAELQALRAQISPHFLFNTLTTIAALTRVDADRAHDLIVDFAKFFRERLYEDREFITLQHELRYVKRYVRFERARFGERLRVDYHIDPQLLPRLVPVLSIQPLVENAITHGLAPRGGRGYVQVAARDRGGAFEVSVSDDGVGMAPGEGGHLHPGFGLANVQQRLAGLCGQSTQLHIESLENRGTTVSFLLPGDLPSVSR